MHKNSPFWYKKYNNFLGGGTPLPTPYPLGAFGTRPAVPLLHAFDTRPCKILDPPLMQQFCKKSASHKHLVHVRALSQSLFLCIVRTILFHISWLVLRFALRPNWHGSRSNATHSAKWLRQVNGVIAVNTGKERTVVYYFIVNEQIHKKCV